uniref:Uncharacterized protein n=1 Tax=Arundo donax TaxID=35708 RepID=A0A0A8Z8H3_ARUDO
MPSVATPHSRCLQPIIAHLVGSTGGEADEARNGICPGMGRRVRAASRLCRHRRLPRRVH